MIAKIELKFGLASVDTEPNALKLQMIHRGEMHGHLVRSKEATFAQLPADAFVGYAHLQSLHSRVRRPRGGHTHYCTPTEPQEIEFAGFRGLISLSPRRFQAAQILKPSFTI